MNADKMNMFLLPPKDSGQRKVQSYTNVGGGAEKVAIFTGIGAPDLPNGKVLVTFFTPLDGQTVYFHLEGSSGAADAAADNGIRLNGYYNEGERTYLVDPRTETHIDMYGVAGAKLNWYISSADTTSQPGG